MNKVIQTVISVMICLFLFATETVRAEDRCFCKETRYEEVCEKGLPTAHRNEDGEEGSDPEEPTDIQDTEVPMAQAPEEQKEDLRKPGPDRGYRSLYLLVGSVIFLLALMMYLLWRLRENKEYQE